LAKGVTVIKKIEADKEDDFERIVEAGTLAACPGVSD
jgi:hypothetical protein